MTNNVNMLNEILNDLNEEGLLQHLILIGSWAEYLYEKNNTIEGFFATLKTDDIDFLVPNIRKPREKVSLPKVLQEKGYLLKTERLTKVNKFIKDKFEIEFLARQVGKPSTHEEVPSLGIKVETLKHMNLMNKNIIKVYYNNIEVIVPSPEAFVLSKMIINKDRTEEKREKDNVSINNMLITLMDSEDNMRKLTRIFYEDATKKERKKILEYIEQNNIPVDFEEYKRVEDI
jgi:hypothetical protein